MGQPWAPPVGDEWNPVELLLRGDIDHPMTIPEGDQNKTDAENAINWIGNRYFDTIVLQTGSYANPPWITSLAYSKITGAPTPLTFQNGLTLTGTTVKLGGASAISESTTLTLTSPFSLTIASTTASSIWLGTNFNFISNTNASEFNLRNSTGTRSQLFSVQNEQTNGFYLTSYGSTYVQVGQLDIADTVEIGTREVNWAVPSPYTLNFWTGSGTYVKNLRIEQSYNRSLNRFSFDRGVQLVPQNNITTPYSVTANDSVLLTLSASGDITLPDTTTLENGHTIVIQSGISSNPTIVPFNPGTENIMGAASYAMHTDESVILVKYPLNWRIIGSYGSTVTTLTFNSGITNTAGVVRLGGSLLATTSIVTNGNNLNISQTSNRAFTAANNGDIFYSTSSGRTFGYDPIGFNSTPSLFINPNGISFTQNAVFHIRGESTTSRLALRIDDSAGTQLMGLTQNGTLNVPQTVAFTVTGNTGNFVVQRGMTVNVQSADITNLNNLFNLAPSASIGPIATEGAGYSFTNSTGSIGGNNLSNIRFSIYRSNPTFNFTGTSTGIIRAFYHSPTLTALASVEHRAYENTTGNLMFGTTSGSVGINLSTAPTAKLHIAAPTGTGASTAPLKLTNSTTNILGTPEVGAFEFGTAGGNNVLFFTRSGTTREAVLTGVLDTGVSTTGIEPNTVIKVRATDGNEYPVAIATI